MGLEGLTAMLTGWRTQVRIVVPLIEPIAAVMVAEPPRMQLKDWFPESTPLVATLVGLLDHTEEAVTSWLDPSL